ncbi:MAG: ABC transporter ATP-binding protein, partial [Bacteroidales bacterium]
MKSVVVVEDISKSFKNTLVLDRVNLSVNEGEIFGLIGPDGAGKTTLFRIITTLILPDSGWLTIFRLDATTNFLELRKHIGYMPGRFSLYHDLTVEENLKFYATVFGTTIEENYDLIKSIYSPLTPFRKRKAGQLSGGMKQKLALSCALIHKPKLLVLDEPTTGVDAVSRVEFWEILASMKQYNISVIVSTPYMDEALKCDRVALIQQGRILITDYPENIKKGTAMKVFKIKASDKFRLINCSRNHPKSISAYPFGDSVHI